MHFFIDMAALNSLREILEVERFNYEKLVEYLTKVFGKPESVIAFVQSHKHIEIFQRYLSKIGIECEVCERNRYGRCTAKIMYGLGLLAKTAQQIIVVSDDPTLLSVTNDLEQRGTKLTVAYFQMNTFYPLKGSEVFHSIQNQEEILNWKPVQYQSQIPQF